MKKITFFLTLLPLAHLCSNATAADKYNYTPYVGIDYIYGQISAHGFSPKHNALGLHIGSDYSAYFGTELFFNQSDNDKNRVDAGKIKTSYRSYGLDLLAYLPLGCSKDFSLLATAGIGEYVYKQKFLGQKHHSEHGLGYRFGGGFKYALTPAWQTRLITRYVNFDGLHGYDHAVEYTLSLQYHF